MSTLVNHNYGTAINNVPPLLAIPIAGIVTVTVKDIGDKTVGTTSTNSKGEWKQSFSLDDGTYTVYFSGRFRPIGSDFSATYQQTLTSFSIKIPIPLTADVDNPVDPDVGATGPMGPRGLTGLQGKVGGTGAQGLVGPAGPAGTTGATGVRGIDGIIGVDGDRGPIGPAGPRGLPGSPGSPGARGPQGPAGVAGDACDLDIGLPSDGYLSDGLLSWESTTKVCEALDDVNEILSALAPSQPLPLSGSSLAMTGVSLFDGKASDKEYQNYKSVAGEDIGATYTGGKIIVADTFTLTNPTAGDTESGGDDTFYPGNEGTLSSHITTEGVEEKKGSIDLTAGLGYDESLTLNAQNSGYNSFNLWVRGDATIDAETYINSGYNKIIMRHDVSGSNRDSADYEIFYDTSTGNPSISTPAISVNIAVYRELSGIQQYGIGSTFNLTFTGSNMFNDTYQEDAFVFSNIAFASIADATIALTDSAWDGTISSPPRYDDSPVLGGSTNYVLTMTVTNQRSTNSRGTVIASKPGRTSASGQAAAKLTDTYSSTSTVLDESFDDEDYRLPDNDGSVYPNNYDTVPDYLTGNWSSSYDLLDGEAVVFHGSLYPPTNSKFDFGGSFGDFSLADPVGPDYSTLTADAVYLRAFKDDGDPHSNGILKLTGLATADVSPVGTGNVNVEIKLPTETGWLDLGTPFNVATFTGADGDGCRSTQSGDDWNMSFGTFSTADSDYTIIVRVTIKNTETDFSRMQITDW